MGNAAHTTTHSIMSKNTKSRIGIIVLLTVVAYISVSSRTYHQKMVELTIKELKQQPASWESPDVVVPRGDDGLPTTTSDFHQEYAVDENGNRLELKPDSKVITCKDRATLSKSYRWLLTESGPVKIGYDPRGIMW